MYGMRWFYMKERVEGRVGSWTSRVLIKTLCKFLYSTMAGWLEGWVHELTDHVGEFGGKYPHDFEDPPQSKPPFYDYFMKKLFDILHIYCYTINDYDNSYFFILSIDVMRIIII